MKNAIYTIICIFIVLFALANSCDNSNRKEAQEEANKPKEKISCVVCSKDLTDTYQRIRPNGEAYFCMPCYKATMRQVNEDIQAEGYD